MGTLRDVFGISDKRSARNAAAQAGLTDYNLLGPGGLSVAFGPTGGSFSLGALDPIRQQLLRAFQQNMAAGPGTAGLSQAARSAMADLGGFQGIDPSFINTLAQLGLGQVGTGRGAPNAPALDPRITQSIGNNLLAEIRGQNMPQFGDVPGIDQGLISGMFGAAQDRLATAGATADQMAADRLAALREQAAPYERQMVQDAVGDLFARGRFGAQDTLSGEVSRNISRGLAEADLSRQMAAQDLGLRVQDAAVQQALGLSGMGAGLVGQEFQQALSRFGAEDAARSSAMARAGALSGLLTDDFSRQLGAFGAQQDALTGEMSRILPFLQTAGSLMGQNAQFGQNAALQRFDVARQLFEAEQMGLGSAFQRALGSLGAVQSMDQQGLQGFLAALNAAVSRSNASLGQASNFAQLSNINPILDFAVGMASAFGPGR